MGKILLNRQDAKDAKEEEERCANILIGREYNLKAFGSQNCDGIERGKAG